MSSDSISPGHNDVSLDDLPRLQNGEVQWRPVRRALEVTAFGVNGYTATQAGVEVIEEHDETSSGAGRHEELYLVITGAADFEVGDELIRAGQGHLVRVSPGVRRRAIATADDTTVLVIGGAPGSAMPPSPFEYRYAAEPAYARGDFDQAVAIASEGLADYPDHPHLNYQLACFHARAGRREDALRHLAIAATDPNVADWARDDSDFDSIRSDARFPS
jgi:Tetratricopeptide repeat